jgi:hypothetical protein
MHDWFKCFHECSGAAFLDMSFASALMAEALMLLTLLFGLVLPVSSGGDHVSGHFVELHRLWGRCR